MRAIQAILTTAQQPWRFAERVMKRGNVLTQQQLRRRERYKQRKAENDAIVADALLVGCVVCGEHDPIVLDFHHRDPAEKSENVKSMSDRTEAKVRAEIAKCVVLCANCHRRVHAGVIHLPADGLVAYSHAY